MSNREIELDLNGFDPQTPFGEKHRRRAHAVLSSVDVGEHGLGIQPHPAVVRLKDDELGGFMHFVREVVFEAQRDAFCVDNYAVHMLIHVLSHLLDTDLYSKTVPDIAEVVQECETTQRAGALLTWIRTNPSRGYEALKELDPAREEVEFFFESVAERVNASEQAKAFSMESATLFNAIQRAFLKEETDILFVACQYLWAAVDQEVFPFEKLRTPEEMEEEIDAGMNRIFGGRRPGDGGSNIPGVTGYGFGSSGKG